MDDSDPRPAFDRREFLKLAGFTFAGAAIAGCDTAKVERAIPYLIKPEEITPGKATWYASTCPGCNAGCGILMKNREGRPIKLEGNPDHPVSRGGLCVVGQAQVLGLYDSLRLQQPVKDGSLSDWETIDRSIGEKLDLLRKNNKSIRLLSGTVTSPTKASTLRKFLSTFRDGRHIVYDAVSRSAILESHKETHGIRVLPRYRFDRAEVILGVDADFLGTWISPVEFTAAYRAGRTLEGNPPRCSFHVQIESRYSLTGARADKRYAIKPSDRLAVLQELVSTIGQKAGRTLTKSAGSGKKFVDGIAERLWSARGKSLVVCGSNDVDSQILTNALNELLGSYGSTLDVRFPSLHHQSNDRDLQNLLKELEDGKVDALFVDGVNPVYDLPNGEELSGLLRNVPLVVSFAERIDETAVYAHYVCPGPHPLSSWSDTEAVEGVLSISQPAVSPLENTRPVLESLSVWMGEKTSVRELVREEWMRNVFPRQKKQKNFELFWNQSVHDGFAVVESRSQVSGTFNSSSLRNVSQAREVADAFQLVLYPKVSMIDGRHAHNAWLQEAPDPVTKITWDNYAILSPGAGDKLGVRSGDVVRLIASSEGETVATEVPVWIQPGQPDEVVAVALGYGRKGTDRFTSIGPKWIEGKPSTGPNGLVGVNAARFLRWKNGQLLYEQNGVLIETTGRKHPLACTQTYHSIDTPPLLAQGTEKRRPFVQYASLEAFTANPAAGSGMHHDSKSMWPEQHKYKGAHWGMMIDLNACTGCTACVVSCQAENNIPVVGKDEVFRNREMHWIRIDRYFMQNGENLDVAHQPMLCQHCDNAPCETVCPVLATVHSDEGLNQQVYNRCVGTRYCANNCPYKIRRFNWFDYPRDDEKQNMVLNPDVTVRSRGVMEKCSFCVQRIQEEKIKAKKEGIPISDGAIKTACEQSCPAQAIVFGDMNDAKSRIASLQEHPRNYTVLGELETRPSVGYMTMIRNRSGETEETPHG